MNAKKTKAYASFCNKITYFNNDIEFIDLLNKLFQHDPSKYPLVYDKINPKIHCSLSKRKTTETSMRQVIEHLSYSIYSAYIKDLYEEVLIYFSEVLSMMIQKGIENPERFIGDSTVGITLKELLESRDLTILVKNTSKKILRELENKKDTLFILNQIPKKLGITVDNDKIKDTLPYLEVRHLLVHNDGRFDQSFKKRFPDFKTRTNSKKRIDLNLKFVQEVSEKIKSLIKEYDKVFIKNDLIPENGIQPNKNNHKK